MTYENNFAKCWITALILMIIGSACEACFSKGRETKVTLFPLRIKTTVHVEEARLTEAKIADVYTPIMEYNESPHPCKKLQPNLFQITSGLQSEFTTVNADKPLRSPIIDLSCPNSEKDGDGFDQPQGLYRSDKRYLETSTLNFNGLSEMLKIKGSLFKVVSSVLNNQSVVSSRNYNIMISTYNIGLYETALNSDIPISKVANDAYFKLPEEYINANQIIEFHKFYKNFGTDYFGNSTIGCQIHLIVGSEGLSWDSPDLRNLEMSVDDLMKAIMNSRRGKHTISSAVGNFKSKMSINENIKRCEERPAVIGGTSMPISSLLDGPSRRSLAFKKGRNFEIAHQQLKKLSILVHGLEDHMGIKNSFVEFINKELQFITPRIGFVELLKNIIEFNPDLLNFYVRCILQEADYKREDYIWPLVPGICVSMDERVQPNFPTCRKVHSANIATSHTCVKFYTNRDCTGESKQFLDVAIGFTKHLDKYLSYLPCQQ